MTAIEVAHVAKSFGQTQAVVDVSFEVGQGEMFGLLGPNGAGKTTTIRMILDIFKPDHGSVAILGGPMDEAKKARVGYMPEERGLYQDAPLEQSLIYLARLKGLAEREARERLGPQLERFDLAAHRKKKIKDLSKGMQQKAQIIATILHRPELLIIDEPFTALDPLNVRLVKDLLRELNGQGVTVIMSAHQMNQVEELCDRILLIDRGRDVLYGSLADIRRKFSGHAVLVRAEGDLSGLPGVLEVRAHNNAMRLTLAETTTPQDVMRALVERGIPVEKFEVAVPSLDEIFIKVVREGAPK